MYLTFGGDIKLDTFEINSSCSSWFHTNVKIEENKKRTLFRSHTYHLYKGKKVIVNVNPIVRSIVARDGNVVDNYIFLVDCFLYVNAGI